MALEARSLVRNTRVEGVGNRLHDLQRYTALTFIRNNPVEMTSRGFARGYHTRIFSGRVNAENTYAVNCNLTEW
jgi:hypothetical protein